MRHRIVMLALAVLCGPGPAPPPAAAGAAFVVAGYRDAGRSSACVEGPPGTVFTHHGFARVPDDAGLAYVTFRLVLPGNLAPVGEPRPGADVGQLIVTPFADGSSEWNLLVTGCPSGWVEVFRQDYRVLDDAPALLAIRATGSMVRDCSFVLHDVEVGAQTAVNTPGCGGVPAAGLPWGRLKARYR